MPQGSLRATLRSERGDLEASVVDLTPAGLGLAILDERGGEELPALGDEVTIVHTSRATSGIEQRAVVRGVGEIEVRGRVVPRLGVSFVRARTPPGSAVDRRRAERYACPEGLPAMAFASCPLFFRERLCFGVTHLSAGGMSATTSLRNKALLPGLRLDLELTLPASGTHQVRGRVVSVRHDPGESSFAVSIAWSEPPLSLLHAMAEYLLAGDKELTPSRLRAGGLAVKSVEQAVTYDLASGEADLRAVSELRHRARGDAERAQIAASFDEHAEHVCCRFGGRIVGCVRVIFVDGDPARSQYVTAGGHEVPEWLWEAGFCEAGAGATDPEFQRAGLFVPLMQHALRVAVQAGYRYMLGACDDALLEIYAQMGFVVVETREVEPSPGWRFRSHLIVLDALSLSDERPEPLAQAMAAAMSW